MPEVWENPFANALLKIERAKKHIADIEHRLTAAANNHGVSLHIDPKTGEQFLYYLWMDRALRPDIALIVGDAVHNLHCSLDIAYRGVLQVVNPAGFDPSRTKFIVGNDRKHLESSLLKTAKIPANSPLFDFLVNRVKSYRKGGDRDIVALHDLDINDKHHSLIPMLTIVGVNGVQLEYEDGTVDNLAIAITSNVPCSRKLRAHPKIKNHGKTIFRVTFSEGDLRDIEMLPTLRLFSGKAERIVRSFQRMR